MNENEAIFFGVLGVFGLHPDIQEADAILQLLPEGDILATY